MNELHMSFERMRLLEQRLCVALDAACFECEVVRMKAGIYKFGPTVSAAVEFAPDDELVAARDGEPFEPISDFIRNLAQETRQAQETPNTTNMHMTKKNSAHTAPISHNNTQCI